MNRASLSDLAGPTFDVLIVGGGITGAAAARDAALRGLSTVLIEKDDFAAGTSSRSSKLLHGGLRYLEKFEFGLVREACRERELMMRLAPHLCTPRPFVYLLYRGYSMLFDWLPAMPWMLRTGLTLYDLFSGNPRDRRHTMLDRRELLRIEPHLNADGLRGGGRYYDFLTDDARLTIETIKGACAAGALAANHTEVVGFVDERGRIGGVEVVDALTGAEGVVRARQIVNTTGPWTDAVRSMEQSAPDRRLVPTKGVHIVLRKRDFPLRNAVFIRSPRDGRTCWPIPALESDLVYVGTTDTFYDGPLDHVTATDEDVDYLLEVANHTLPESRVGREHLVGTWAGLRPLVKPSGAGAAASTISREHEVFVGPRGLLNIAGGKLTTARVMGRDVIDAAVRLLSEHHGRRGIPASTTAEVPLGGGAPELIDQARRAAGEAALPGAVTERLLGRYGGNFARIAERLAADPDLARSMGGHDLVAAEVHYGVEEEMARTVTDFLARRATLFYWLEDGGLDVADAVAGEMGRLLGWDATERAAQVQAYRRWVEANRFVPVA